ncbi:N-acetyltransferase [Rhizorhapis suberifaciens]|uniref:GNAT superfamily N-acetyltransferase n=1 Tax=Rhizorhapis suberifaciens TaxID=13656 RepID=A0A840HS65_9SPHN|nr:N-acetyltransferase [Rhizorhapis suberifaciens]MBB4640551.1 GNAT superfamily N-acetyltransferase [Rhizorhapis suberifaciens]
MKTNNITVAPVSSKTDLKAFVELPWAIYAIDPNWVPPLKDEVYGLLTPGKNPWFEHGEAQYFLARRAGEVTGRISAHIDHLALQMPPEQGMGPGTGNWGLFEAKDAESAAALIQAAEDWLRDKGMTRALGPLSISIWDEPGLLIKGHDHPPTVMMGHHRAEYQAWIEAAQYQPAKQLLTYDLDITRNFPPLIERVVQSGEKSSRITIRRVNKARFDEEAAIIMHILNDAWSDNWGFIPLTDSEIAFAGKKLKPIVFEDLIRIAEVEGEPVAFMITLPDLNEALTPLNGSLFPFGWAKLLWWLRAPKVRTMRVPLMGVVKRLQASRLASQLAFMMIEYIRRDAITRFNATRGEIGWVLDDNQGMNAIADAIEAKVNKVYQIYDKAL